MANFRSELEKLINQHSMENGSDTPDFILARYITGCLGAFDEAVASRTHWYGLDKLEATTRPKGSASVGQEPENGD